MDGEGEGEREKEKERERGTKRGIAFGSKQTTSVRIPRNLQKQCEWTKNRSLGNPGLGFVGMALDLSGSSWAVSRHRLAQGTVAMRTWAPLFHSKVDKRQTKVATDGCIGVGQRATEQRAVGTVSTILGGRRRALVGIDVWWRRLHRPGHGALNRGNLSLSKWSTRLIHRDGGDHLARFSADTGLQLQ